MRYQRGNLYTLLGRVDEPLEVEPFAVREISLMRSTLRPQGAQHDVVASFPLEGE